MACHPLDGDVLPAAVVLPSGGLNQASELVDQVVA